MPAGNRNVFVVRLSEAAGDHVRAQAKATGAAASAIVRAAVDRDIERQAASAARKAAREGLRALPASRASRRRRVAGGEA